MHHYVNGNVRIMQAITSSAAPKAIGPYSQAVKTNDFLFVSGQLPIDPESLKIIGDTIEKQTEQVLKNIKAILKAAGLTTDHVVSCDVMLQNLDDFSAFNAVYAACFTSGILPARKTFQVARLPMDALVEISCIATVKT
jgi:2-iminobutanoate/2-iminopropanoate deaminase